MKKPLVIPLLALLLAFASLTAFEADYLYRVQELNLFLHTPLFFRQCMVTSGGFLTWAGAYLTQFCHFPALGAAVLCLLWAVLIILLKKTFSLPWRWMPMTLIPVACLLLTVTSLGYWIFYLKLRGYMFDATLGTLVAVTLAFLYLHIPRRMYLRSSFIVVAACLGYPLFGFYALWGLLLMAVLAWCTDSHRILDTSLVLLAIIAVPWGCYWLIYHETNIVNIYWTALPVFCHNGERFPVYHLPYMVLVASTVIMAMTFSKKRTEKVLNSRNRWTQAAVLAATLAAVVVCWYKDANFHCELSMMRAIEQQEWEKAVSLGAKVKGEPTRAICLMRNLSLARTGRQGDEMFRYPMGAKRPDAPFTVKMTDTAGRLLYLHYGVLNYCYRWCMENGVEYGWSVEKLKLMVQCSLLKGELPAAQKYLSLLKKSDFQQEWVKQYNEYVHHPQLMAKDAGLQAIACMEQRDDFLTSDMGQIESFLLEHFTTAQSADPSIQEQALVATMLTRNAALFWQHLYAYLQSHGRRPLPRHYQEATCLFALMQGRDMTQLPVSQDVAGDCHRFLDLMDKCQQQGLSEEQTRQKAGEAFHDTYYYYFFFDNYSIYEQ